MWHCSVPSSSPPGGPKVLTAIAAAFNVSLACEENRREGEEERRGRGGEEERRGEKKRRRRVNDRETEEKRTG